MWLIELWLKRFLRVGRFCGLSLVSVLWCLIVISWCLTLCGAFLHCPFSCLLSAYYFWCVFVALLSFPGASETASVCLLCMSLEPLQIVPVALQLKGGVEGPAACKATVFSWSPLSCSLALSPCFQCWTILQHADLESTKVDWALVPPCAWQEAGICSALLV